MLYAALDESLAVVYQHPLVLTVNSKSQANRLKKRQRVTASRRLTYKQTTADCISEVLEELERTKQAYMFLGAYSVGSSWRSRYTEAQYIQYHLEVYITSITSLIDKLLILINQIYQFGLIQNHVRMKQIVDRLKSGGHEGLVTYLAAIQAGTGTVKLLRNQTQHVRRFSDQALLGIHRGELELRSVKKENNYDQKLLLEKKVKAYRRVKQAQITANNKQVYKVIGLIFDEIEPIYKQSMLDL